MFQKREYIGRIYENFFVTTFFLATIARWGSDSGCHFGHNSKNKCAFLIERGHSTYNAGLNHIKEAV